MTLYADSNVLLTRDVDEPDSERADELLASDDVLVTGRHAVVEVRRNLARLLEGTAPSPGPGLAVGCCRSVAVRSGRLGDRLRSSLA